MNCILLLKYVIKNNVRTNSNCDKILVCQRLKAGTVCPPKSHIILYNFFFPFQTRSHNAVNMSNSNKGNPYQNTQIGFQPIEICISISINFWFLHQNNNNLMRNENHSIQNIRSGPLKRLFIF